VTVNGRTLDEPYVAFEPAERSAFREGFPAQIYSDQRIDLGWWRQMRSLTQGGSWWCPRDSILCLATTATTATIRDSGGLFRDRQSWRVRW